MLNPLIPVGKIIDGKFGPRLKLNILFALMISGLLILPFFLVSDCSGTLIYVQPNKS